jgi:hypothetical protein
MRLRLVTRETGRRKETRRARLPLATSERFVPVLLRAARYSTMRLLQLTS